MRWRLAILRSAPVSYKEVAAGDPSLDSRAFRQCLGQYATGVTVITTAVDGELAGVTRISLRSSGLRTTVCSL